MESTPEVAPAGAARTWTMAMTITMTSGVFGETGLLGRPQTILLVEGEAFVRKATAEVLESAGYCVATARSPAEALEVLRVYSHSVDLLLADVVMPGMSGRELATEFNILCPSAQVLLMSGGANELALCQLSLSCERYLRKPFSAPSLLSEVREALGAGSRELKIPSNELEVHTL
jgi:two-component system, cell cycle sensor histidine kinase and response regulator CckA